MRELIQGQFTKAAMKIYLAVFEGRNWDREWNYLDGNRGVYNDVMNGNRSIRLEEWS